MRDIRSFGSEVYKTTFAAGIGIMIPEYQREKDILLLGNKGDNTIQHVGLGPQSLSVFSKFDGLYFLTHTLTKQKTIWLHEIFSLFKENDSKIFVLHPLT